MNGRTLLSMRQGNTRNLLEGTVFVVSLLGMIVASVKVLPEAITKPVTYQVEALALKISKRIVVHQVPKNDEKLESEENGKSTK